MLGGMVWNKIRQSWIRWHGGGGEAAQELKLGRWVNPTSGATPAGSWGLQVPPCAAMAACVGKMPAIEGKLHEGWNLVCGPDLGTINMLLKIVAHGPYPVVQTCLARPIRGGAVRWGTIAVEGKEHESWQPGGQCVLTPRHAMCKLGGMHALPCGAIELLLVWLYAAQGRPGEVAQMLRCSQAVCNCRRRHVLEGEGLHSLPWVTIL